MTAKTIHEIEADYSRERTELLQEYHREIDDVRAVSSPEDVPYLDKLTPQARDEVLREQKGGAKDGARERAIGRYREATEGRREQIEARKARLEKALFRVAGTPGEAMLPHAAAADEEGLMGLLAAAVVGGSADQARAVLAVAHRRGMPAVVSAYLKRANPQADELYAEYQAIPTPEQMETAAEQAETFVHDTGPGMLRYGPRVA